MKHIIYGIGWNKDNLIKNMKYKKFEWGGREGGRESTRKEGMILYNELIMHSNFFCGA